MQETEKIKADNQISKNENLVQVCFFNQSRFKTNRKAVNLSHGRGFPRSPGGPCSPAHRTERRLGRCCRRPAAWPRAGTAHGAGKCPAAPWCRFLACPPQLPGAGSGSPGAAGPAARLPPALGALFEAVRSFGLVPCSGGAKQGARWPRADGGTSTAGCAGRAHPALPAEPAAPIAQAERGTIPAALVSSRQRVRLTRGRAGPATHRCPRHSRRRRPLWEQHRWRT